MTIQQWMARAREGILHAKTHGKLAHLSSVETGNVCFAPEASTVVFAYWGHTDLFASPSVISCKFLQTWSLTCISQLTCQLSRRTMWLLSGPCWHQHGPHYILFVIQLWGLIISSVDIQSQHVIYEKWSSHRVLRNEIISHRSKVVCEKSIFLGPTLIDTRAHHDFFCWITLRALDRSFLLTFPCWSQCYCPIFDLKSFVKFHLL